MTLRSKILLDVSALLSAAVDLGGTSSPLKYRKAYTFTDGSGANQASKIFQDQRTLGASATEDLDLAGSLTNPLLGATVFSKIRGMLIAPAAANTNTVNVGGAASNGWITWVGDATDVVKVRPGGLILLLAPDVTAYAVTAATGDLLTVTNGGGTTPVTYDIILLGS